MKLLSVNHVSVPVISVGNITAGGTGKTPFVELLVKLLTLKGNKVAVVSRGYRRRSSGTVIVSDGHALLETAEHSGDEPYQIAAKFRSAVVVVDAHRYQAAKLSVEKFNVDVVLLDDGFQHRSLHRDLDIVMIDEDQSVRRKRLLPAGLMREPLSSLRRADVLVRSSGDGGNTGDTRRFDSKPVVTVRRIPKTVELIDRSKARPVRDLRDTQCIAFCGIGNPQSFRRTLDETGLHVKEFFIFGDHYPYSQRDMANIEECAKKLATEFVVTTEKDAVRLEGLVATMPWLSAHCHFLEIELVVIHGEEILNDRIDQMLRKAA